MRSISDKLRNSIGTISLIGTLALGGCVTKGNHELMKHPLMEGKLENGITFRASHNQDSSWRMVRVESKDGIYVVAEDKLHDNDGRFDTITYNSGSF